MLNGLKGYWVLTVLVAILAIAGCSNNSPVAFNTNDSAEISLNRAAVDLDTIVAAQAITATQNISSALGGQITLNRSGHVHKFTVAKGALSKSEVISVKASNDFVSDKPSLAFEFGPDGLVFIKAAHLDVDMSDVNPNAVHAKLYYFDPKVQDWVLQGETDVINGRATFAIYHFSKYAISD